MNPKRRAVILCVLWLMCPSWSNDLAMAEPRAGDARKTLTYAGIVTDEARMPIAGVEVRAMPLKGESGKPQITLTDERGEFELSGVPQFHHGRTSRYLVCEHPEYGIAWQQLTAVEARNPHFDPHDLHVRMAPRGEFGGSVTDGTGQPVKGADVSINLKQSLAVTSHITRFNYYSVTATTDDQGQFRLVNLPKGIELGLHVQHPEYVTFRDPAGNYPYQTADRPIKVQLSPGASVAGRLLYNGKPLLQPGVRIGAIDPQKGEAGGWARTDAEGRFRITGLEANSYVVHVAQGEELFGSLVAPPAQGVETTVGRTATADLACVRGTSVTGRVTDHEGQTIGQHTVRVALLEPHLNLYWTNTDDDGRFRLRLPSGTYELKTMDRALPPPSEISQKVVVDDEESQPVEFQIAKGGVSTKSRLVDADGRPMTGSAMIHRRWIHSDDRGYVPSGSGIKFHATEAGFAISDDKSLAAGFYWQADKEEPPDEIVLQPPAIVIGRIHDDSGARVTADMLVVSWIWKNGNSTTIGWQDGIAWTTVDDDGSFQIKLPTGVALAVTLFDGTQDKTILPPTDLEPGETRDLGEIHLPRPAPRAPRAVIAGPKR